jgi:hypothetical protein
VDRGNSRAEDEELHLSYPVSGRSCSIFIFRARTARTNIERFVEFGKYVDRAWGYFAGHKDKTKIAY